MAEQTPLQIVTPTIANSASIATMGSRIGPVGTRGAASFELPLPLSGARHLTPALALHYNSQSGNGTFGIGMQLSLASIARRTSEGVPHYADDDVMIDADGVERWPEFNEGMPVIRTLAGPGSRACSVVRYYPRIESAFDVYELWSPDDGQAPFWRVQGSNGHLYCYGNSEASRIAAPRCRCRSASAGPHRRMVVARRTRPVGRAYLL